MAKPFVVPLGAVALFYFTTIAAVGYPAESSARRTNRTLRIGAFAIDVTPTEYPVIVNGMFEERTADRDVDPLFARAFVLDDGSTRIALAVVDSCMLPRELLDAVKAEASKHTGIPVDHMLISATHTHSAPSSMGVLGSRPDPNYPTFLIPRIARAIEKANDKLQSAQIGFAKIHAPEYTYCRRYIRRSDRVFKDPFGDLNVRANMHPGFLSPDAIGPSGPVDDELSLVAMQTTDGKPLGVLANFSMHYVGSPMLSSDYFGRFAEHLAKRLDGSDGSTSCIVSMSQGTSGDLASMNYNAAAVTREYDRFANELATKAYDAYRQISKYDRHASLAIREAKLALKRRTPDEKRLAWAKSMATTIGDRRPKGWPEVYALEQLELAAEPQRELKLQAVRIGDTAIAAIPDEVFAITGLKLKQQSPLANTFTIELANGADGYIPPPEQHKLGGYTTWPARTAGLEVEAEPKIVAMVLKLLEDVTGRPRRPLPDVGGAYAYAVLKSKPRAYWRLAEIAGDTAADSSGHHNDARYDGNVAYFLPGPPGKGMSDDGQSSRAVHLVGGIIRAEISDLSKGYSVEFWFWNGMPNDARSSMTRLCRCAFQRSNSNGDHLAITGNTDSAGHLLFSNGHTLEDAVFLKSEGTTQAKTWNHIVFVREGINVHTYLNGRMDPGLTGEAPFYPREAGNEWYFGGDKGPNSGLEGKLSDIAIYDRALPADEIANHYAAADVAQDK
jgi:hypothetical protein